MGGFLLFMFFSTIEGISIYALALYVFRYNFLRYLGHSLIIIELINFQNYLTREEISSMSYMAPVINLLITALFFKTIVRIPLIGAFLMTVVGYAGFIVIQAALIEIMFSMDQVQSDPVKGRIIQLATGLLVMFAGWAIYRLGYGFTRDFERMRFHWEHLLVIAMIIVFIILLGLMMYFMNVFASLIGFLLALVVFLYYAIRKEASDS